MRSAISRLQSRGLLRSVLHAILGRALEGTFCIAILVAVWFAEGARKTILLVLFLFLIVLGIQIVMSLCTVIEGAARGKLEGRKVVVAVGGGMLFAVTTHMMGVSVATPAKVSAILGVMAYVVVRFGIRRGKE